VSPVRYELDFISQKTALFIVIAVKTSNLTNVSKGSTTLQERNGFLCGQC
jgi:hypothetical protein